MLHVLGQVLQRWHMLGSQARNLRQLLVVLQGSLWLPLQMSMMSNNVLLQRSHEPGQSTCGSNATTICSENLFTLSESLNQFRRGVIVNVQWALWAFFRNIPIHCRAAQGKKKQNGFQIFGR